MAPEETKAAVEVIPEGMKVVAEAIPEAGNAAAAIRVALEVVANR